MRHNFEGGHSVFELNRGEHHDHMVHGFELTDHSLVLYVKKKAK